MTTTSGADGPIDDTSRARQGLTWMVSSLAILAFAQLAYTSATSRIVSPREFGYYASAQALAALAGYLSLSAVGLSVIRHKSSNGLRRAGVTLAMSTGLAAGGIIVAVGAAWATLWGIPEAADAARVAGVGVAMAPLTGVLTGLQRRKLRYRQAALAEFVGPMIGFAFGLALALAWKNALALILGQALASAATAALCLPGSAPERRPDDVRVSWRSLLGFSTNVSAQNFVYYVIYSLPPFAVSRSLGAHALGIYGRATALITLPLAQLTQAVSKVLYPLWARRTRPQEIIEPFSDVLVGASLVGLLGFGALFGAATPICRVLLGPDFIGVDGVVRVLAIFGALNVQLSISGSLQGSVDGCVTFGPCRLSSWGSARCSSGSSGFRTPRTRPGFW